MKSIEQKTIGQWSTFNVVKEVCSLSPAGMNLAQMRGRVRVLDALEEAGTTKDIMLEDADFNTLKDAIENQNWRVADKDLLAIVDSVLAAKKTTKAK